MRDRNCLPFTNTCVPVAHCFSFFCCVFCFVLFVCVLCLVFNFLVSLDSPVLITPSVISNVYGTGYINPKHRFARCICICFVLFWVVFFFVCFCFFSFLGWFFLLVCFCDFNNKIIENK